jgi:hypothetical protein
MKADSRIDPTLPLRFDAAAWLAVYCGVSGLVDFNIFAFASIAAASCGHSNRVLPWRKHNAHQLRGYRRV